MRILLFNPIAIALAIAGGIAICHVASIDPHVHDMWLAAGACLAAAEVAMIPLLLTRHATQGQVAQAGLAATVIHMLLAVALGAGAWARSQSGNAFLYWLLAFYWLTLVAVGFASIRAIRGAQADSASAASAK